MELAQDRDRKRTLVSTVKNFGSHKSVGNFLTSCKVWLAFQEGLCSMQYKVVPILYMNTCTHFVFSRL
jgi:hypothetical protein